MKFLPQLASQNCITWHCAFMICVVLSGCRTSPELTALQQESRRQQNHIRTLEDRLQDSEEQLVSQDLELQTLRDNQSAPAIRGVSLSRNSGSAVEQASLWASVRSVRIHRLTSGLYEFEGERRLRIVVQPLDSDGEVIKVPGALKIQVSLPDGEVVTEQWSLTESRSLWQWNLVASGFALEIPMAETAAEVQARVTFRLAKEREFQAEASISL